MEYLSSKAGPAIVLVLLALAFIAWRSHESTNSANTHAVDHAAASKASGAASTASSSPPTAATTQSDPTTVEQDKAQLVRRVNAFAVLFYARGPSLGSDTIRRSIEPYATGHFLRTASFGYGNSEADRQMIRERATLEVSPDSNFMGEYLDANTVQGSINLKFTKIDTDGNVVVSHTAYKEMTWIRENGTWLIYEAPST